MKIILRSYLEKEVRQAMSEHPILGKLVPADCFASLDAGDNRYISMDASSDGFEAYLRICKTVGKRTPFWPSMVIDKSELDHVKLFEAQSSGLVLRESDAVYSYNLNYLKSLPLRETAADASIRLMPKAFKKSVSFPSNAIYALADWSDEYVISARVKQLFEEAGLTGFAGNPIFSLNGQEIPNYFLLYTDSILPPVVRDRTVLVSGQTPKTCVLSDFRKLGYLCYDTKQIITRGDFHRSAEPFCSHRTPSTIVGRKAKECIEANKLKGVKFKPVLGKDTALYQCHSKLWEDVFTLLEKHSISPFWFV